MSYNSVPKCTKGLLISVQNSPPSWFQRFKHKYSKFQHDFGNLTQLKALKHEMWARKKSERIVKSSRNKTKSRAKNYEKHSTIRLKIKFLNWADLDGRRLSPTRVTHSKPTTSWDQRDLFTVISFFDLYILSLLRHFCHRSTSIFQKKNTFYIKKSTLLRIIFGGFGGFSTCSKRVNFSVNLSGIRLAPACRTSDLSKVES